MRLSHGRPPVALLEVERLTLGFGGVQALADLDLTLESGQILSIIGPNGCGKTTFFNVLTGILEPDRGTIRLAGQDLRGLLPHHRAALGIGRKFQVPSLFDPLDVAENMRIAIGDRSTAHGRGDQVGAILAEIGMTAVATIPVAGLPHGDRQRLELAMVLASRPRLVLLDEPTAGLGPGETSAIVGTIRQATATTGAAFIVIEHDLAFVRELDAPVGFMLRGRIERRGSYDELARDPLVRETYLGTRE